MLKSLYLNYKSDDLQTHSNGRAKWIRTIEMTESKSVALPLGYSPTCNKNGGEGRIRTIELGESGFTVRRV